MTIWLGTRIGGTAALFMILMGCGDPLISSTAYETPLFTLHGTLNPAPDDLASPRVDVVWVDPAGLRDDLPEPPRDAVLSLDHAGYAFSLFAPPPATAIRDIVDPATGTTAASFAFGEIVLYDDVDGDGSFQVTSLADGSKIVPPDVYRGATAHHVVVYIERPWSAATEPPELVGLLTGPPGYHLRTIDCTAPDVPRTYVSGDTDVEIIVLPNPTSELPYLRTCLRTHPVDPAGGGSSP